MSDIKSKYINNNKDKIKNFLENYTTEYDIQQISNNRALLLENNMRFNGRVSNFIIDKNDIKYFTNILNKILNANKISDSYVPNTYEELNNDIILLIIDWIQLRLNTRKLFKYTYWDYLNKLYISECFEVDNFIDLVKNGNTNTNMRNIFFGDCREHELFLHVILKIFLDKQGISDKFKLYKYYGYGTTITNKTKNKEYWEKQDTPIFKSELVKKFIDSNPIKGGSIFTDKDQITLDTWEHTHPLIYINNPGDKDDGKIIAIDALGHKTEINNNMIERHNVILNIEEIENPDNNKYSIWYDNMIDNETRIYIEYPTSFSKNIPSYIKNTKSLLYSFDFNENKLKSNIHYNDELKILNFHIIPDDNILTEINKLCLNVDKIPFMDKRKQKNSRLSTIRSSARSSTRSSRLSSRSLR
jgi:hypothetical protein